MGQLVIISLQWHHNGRNGSLTIVYSIVYSSTDQRKHQSFASLAFVRGIHRGLVNSLHKGPVMRKMFPFDDVIIYSLTLQLLFHTCSVIVFFSLEQYSALPISHGHFSPNNPWETPIACPKRASYGCLSWVQSVTKVLPLTFLCSVQ